MYYGFWKRKKHRNKENEREGKVQKGKAQGGTRLMAQWLTTQAALPEGPGLIPTTQNYL